MINSQANIFIVDWQKNRQKQVVDYLSTLNSQCLALGVDFKHTICEIHPTLDDSEGTKDVSNDTIRSLADVVSRLREVKRQRWQKVILRVLKLSVFFIISPLFCKLPNLCGSASSFCNFSVGVVESDGYTNGGMKDISECYQ